MQSSVHYKPVTNSLHTQPIKLILIKCILVYAYESIFFIFINTNSTHGVYTFELKCNYYTYVNVMWINALYIKLQIKSVKIVISPHCIHTECPKGLQEVTEVRDLFR